MTLDLFGYNELMRVCIIDSIYGISALIVMNILLEVCFKYERRKHGVLMIPVEDEEYVSQLYL